MASFTINVEHSKDQNWATATVKNRNDLVNLCKQIASGALTGDTLDLHTSASNLVAASGSIAITHANVTNNDTTTIGGVVITAATSGNGTTSWTIGANATADAVALAACINANTTLSKHLTASIVVAGTVTLTAKLKGSIGNLIVLATSDATAFTLTQLTGGTGGPETARQAIEA